MIKRTVGYMQDVKEELEEIKVYQAGTMNGYWENECASSLLHRDIKDEAKPSLIIDPVGVNFLLNIQRFYDYYTEAILQIQTLIQHIGKQTGTAEIYGDLRESYALYVGKSVEEEVVQDYGGFIYDYKVTPKWEDFFQLLRDKQENQTNATRYKILQTELDQLFAQDESDGRLIIQYGNEVSKMGLGLYQEVASVMENMEQFIQQLQSINSEYNIIHVADTPMFIQQMVYIEGSSLRVEHGLYADGNLVGYIKNHQVVAGHYRLCDRYVQVQQKPNATGSQSRCFGVVTDMANIEQVTKSLDLRYLPV